MRVVVLGAGVVGLTTAVSLLRAGFEVEVVTADPAERTTSYLAAAVWFPTHAGPPDKVAAWGAETYAVLAEQAAAGVPGVVMRESLSLFRHPPGRPAWAAAVGDVRAARPSELPPGYGHGLRYVVPLVEMPQYLPWLAAAVHGLGGRIRTERVGSLPELFVDGVDAVVNCAGLAARELAADDSVHPVRGQIVRVTNPGLTLSVRDEQHPGGRAYVHPRRRDCILGGTLDVGRWDTDVDLAAGQAIIERCTDLVPELRGATVLAHVVGLRPGRPTIRLAVDPSAAAGGRLIHNYGHGGSGVTVSWGCARAVTALLEG